MDLDPRQYDHVVINDNDVRDIVLSYLVHNCFKETAESFIACAGMKQPSGFPVNMDTRKSIFQYAMEGNALKAIELTEQIAPDLLEGNKDLHFDLLSLHFVELVRSKKCTEALEFAQAKLTTFGKVHKYVEKLEDFMALLAYEEPKTSPMFHLLTLDYRQSVAENLNRAILGKGVCFSPVVAETASSELVSVEATTDDHSISSTALAHANMPKYSSMEKLIQHATVLRQYLNQELGKDAPSPFSLKAFLNS